MAYGKSKAVIEAKLAVAHRAITAAKNAADESGDDGMWLDLQQIEVEIVRLAESSLRSKVHKRILAQQTLYDALSEGPS
jgi:hypothetical protein